MTIKQSELSLEDKINILKSHRVDVDLNLSTRSRCCLKGMLRPEGLSLFELLNYDPSILLMIRNFGKRSLYEVRRELRKVLAYVQISENEIHFPLLREHTLSEQEIVEKDTLYFLKAILDKLNRVFPDEEHA